MTSNERFIRTVTDVMIKHRRVNYRQYPIIESVILTEFFRSKGLQAKVVAGYVIFEDGSSKASYWCDVEGIISCVLTSKVTHIISKPINLVNEDYQFDRLKVKIDQRKPIMFNLHSYAYVDRDFFKEAVNIPVDDLIKSSFMSPVSEVTFRRMDQKEVVKHRQEMGKYVVKEPILGYKGQFEDSIRKMVVLDDGIKEILTQYQEREEQKEPTISSWGNVTHNQVAILKAMNRLHGHRQDLMNLLLDNLDGKTIDDRNDRRKRSCIVS